MIKEAKTPSFGLAITVLMIDAVIICVGVLSFQFGGVTVGLGQGAHGPLFIASVITAVSGFFMLNVSWRIMEERICQTISVAIQAMLILMIVGMLIGTWIQAGTSTSMIYYGLNLLSPKYFLLAAVGICTVVSLSNGDSWGTTGTIGMALMGIGAGIGVPEPLTAGFVISGAYFGDKMSPLSETTNLAPAVSGGELFSHIRAMCFTTIPPFIFVLAISFVLGMEYSGDIDSTKISLIQDILKEEFVVSYYCLIPPAIVLALSFAKIPAIPGVTAGIISGMMIGMYNGNSFGDMLGALYDGYVPKLITQIAEADAEAMAQILGTAGISGYPFELLHEVGILLKDLFTSGGAANMLSTVAMVFMALMLGGILEVCGYLDVILNRMLAFVRSAFGLVSAVTVSCVFSNIFLPDQYLSLVIPGRMFRKSFDEMEFGGRKMAPEMLSRSLEDSGTMTSVLVPWNTCGAYNAGVLGVSTFDYAPYAVLNYLVPIFSLLITRLGWGIKWRDKDREKKGV